MNLTTKIIIWVVSISGLSLFLFSALGGKFNREYLPFFGILFVSLIVIAPIGYGIYILFKMPLYIRTLRMNSLARKYNLNFDNEKFLLALDQPHGRQFNRISGVVNGHQVEIWDYMERWRIGLRTSFSIYSSVLSTDISKKRIMGILWFPGISKIEKWLKSLK